MRLGLSAPVAYDLGVKRKVSSLVALVAVASGVACCTVILGDDFEVSGGTGGSTTTTSTTTSGSGGGDCGTLTDCDGLPGCETNLETSTEHCGACGHACSSFGADSVSCNAGSCDHFCTLGSADCVWPASPAPDDGCETQLGTPGNCSTCGHVCEATCTDFDCDAHPIYGTAAVGSVRALLADGATVFWSDRQYGKVARVDVDGSGYDELSSGSLLPVFIAVDTTHLYWQEDTGSLVRRVPVGGGASQNMAGVAARGVGVNATYLYYTTSSGLLRKMKDPLASATTVFTVAATALHVTGTDVYFATANSLRHYNEMNGTTNLLYSINAGFTIDRITSDGASLYWVASDNQVYEGARTGAGSGPVASGGGVRDVAVDSTNIYFTDELADAVMQVPIGGGAAAPIVTTVSRPYAVAADGTAVYFSSILDGNIYKKQLAP